MLLIIKPLINGFHSYLWFIAPFYDPIHPIHDTSCMIRLFKTLLLLRHILDVDCFINCVLVPAMVPVLDGIRCYFDLFNAFIYNWSSFQFRIYFCFISHVRHVFWLTIRFNGHGSSPYIPSLPVSSPSPHTGPWNRAFFSSMAPGLNRVELDPKPAAEKLDPDPTFQIIKEKMQI